VHNFGWSVSLACLFHSLIIYVIHLYYYISAEIPSVIYIQCVYTTNTLTYR
jgi:hypothetical protein